MAISHVPSESAAKSDASCAPAAILATAADPALARLLAAWERLTDDDREAVVQYAERLGLEGDVR